MRASASVTERCAAIPGGIRQVPDLDQRSAQRYAGGGVHRASDETAPGDSDRLGQPPHPTVFLGKKGN